MDTCSRCGYGHGTAACPAPVVGMITQLTVEVPKGNKPFSGQQVVYEPDELTALRARVKELEAVLLKIQKRDEKVMWNRCPDCSELKRCNDNMICRDMPRSDIGTWARAALAGREE